jgi:stage V sporulation protein B
MPAQDRASPPPKDDGNVARTAGRGGLAVATAKLYFILMGTVQQVLLPWVLGLASYGALARVLAFSAVVYNPIVTASIQGMSRAVAQASPGTEGAVIRRTLGVHAALACLLGLLFLVLAGPIGVLFNAPHVITGLRIAALIIFFYGLYSPLVGVLNGRKKFVWQAGFDMVFGTLRTALLALGGYLGGKTMGHGMEGAMLGFALATAVIFLGAQRVVGSGRPGEAELTARQHLVLMAPLLVGQTLLNLLLQADVSLLGAFASGAAKRAGLGPEVADPLVGAYRMTQLFSFLPYQLLISVTFILFPLLAQAHHQGDREAVSRYVRTGVRIALLVAGAMVSVTSGIAGPLFRLLFPPEAAELGVRPMQLLTLGFGAFALFGIFTTVLNSLGRERASAVITTLAFSLVGGLCWLFLSGAPFDGDLLWKTAVSTSIGLTAATVAAGVLVQRTARASVEPFSLARVGFAMAITITVGRHLPHAGKPVTIGYALGLGLLYALLLLLTREIGRADLELVRKVLRRKAG